MSVQVYLDSSDYSNLTDPRELSRGLDAIRDRLVAWAASGEVEFRYSGAHISEMSPLAPQYVGAAKARGDLLVELCGRKTMVSIDEIMRREITAVTQHSGPPADVYSDTGDWFPPLNDFLSPVSLVDTVKKELEAITREQGANRAQRRAIKRRALKGNNLSAEAKRHLLTNPMERLKEVLLTYPMREEDFRVLHRHAIGNATTREAEEAFLNSLRDPTWMIGWFAKHSDKLNPVIQWVREPAEAMHKSLINIAKDVRELRDIHRELSLDPSGIPGDDPEVKQKLRSKLFLTIGRRLANEFGLSPSDSSLEDEDLLSRNAPGLTVCVTSAVDSMWNSLSANPRKPKESDFVDVIHALYTPYVDVFRTDGYMAPIIANAAKRYGTKVVGKLANLVATIELALEVKR